MASDWIRLCPHCNNVTPHQLIYDGVVSKLYDEIQAGDAETRKILENFVYILLQCSTCQDYSLIGGFNLELPESQSQFPVLYPDSDDLGSSVPEKLRKVYGEASRIRRKAPNAYAGQIRRALEFLCKDQEAKGAIFMNNLSHWSQKVSFHRHWPK